MFSERSILMVFRLLFACLGVYIYIYTHVFAQEYGAQLNHMASFYFAHRLMARIWSKPMSYRLYSRDLPKKVLKKMIGSQLRWRNIMGSNHLFIPFAASNYLHFGSHGYSYRE